MAKQPRNNESKSMTAEQITVLVHDAIKKENAERKIPTHNKAWFNISAFAIASFAAIVSTAYIIHQFYSDKPKFTFHQIGVTGFYSETYYGNAPSTMFFIICTVGNDGKKRLVPQGYTCELTIKETGETHQLVSFVPDTALQRIQSRRNVFIYDSLRIQNLTAVKQISADDAVYGNILFGGKGYIDFKGKTATFKVKCVDIYNKKYTSKFTVSFTADPNEQMPRTKIGGVDVFVDTLK